MKSGENPRISVRFLGTVGKNVHFCPIFSKIGEGGIWDRKDPGFADGGDLKGNMGRSLERAREAQGRLDICGKHNTK